MLNVRKPIENRGQLSDINGGMILGNTQMCHMKERRHSKIPIEATFEVASYSSAAGKLQEAKKGERGHICMRCT